MHAAYDDLPEAMKRRIAGLKAVHVFESKFSPRKLRPLDEQSRAVLPPPTWHPIVRVHPENGRKALYLNPVRIEAIEGMPVDEALALVAELIAHATHRKYEYRHQWRYGDMLIWDNRSVMHQANGDYDMNEVRHLHRIMIKGEPVIAAATGRGGRRTNLNLPSFKGRWRAARSSPTTKARRVTYQFFNKTRRAATHHSVCAPV
jgi:taurine dioxygenase